MKRLVLFDIDGTLLSSNGAASRAFRRALEEVFGTSGPSSGYSFAGRTDPQIARDLLSLAGIGHDDIERGLHRIWPLYTDYLTSELPRVGGATPYPGVKPLLERLHLDKGAAVLGLLTGNIAEGARLKLESAGLDFSWFRVSAFGSDDPDRRKLPGIALERAAASLRRDFEGKAVVIIGDTPLDVSCGEHLGVRTIAVATGTYSSAQLQECGPDYLFEDLTDLPAVCDSIFGSGAGPDSAD